MDHFVDLRWEAFGELEAPRSIVCGADQLVSGFERGEVEDAVDPAGMLTGGIGNPARGLSRSCSRRKLETHSRAIGP